MTRTPHFNSGLWLIVIVFISAIAYYFVGQIDISKITSGLALSRNIDDMNLKTSETDFVSETHLGSYLSGRYARHTGDFRKAQEEFQDVINTDPDNILLWRRYLFLALVNQQREEAIKSAYHIFGHDDNYDLSNLIVISDSFLNQDTKKARKILDQIMKKQEWRNQHFEIFKLYLAPILKAWIWVAEGDMDKALIEIDQLSQFSDLMPIYAIQKAFIYEKFGKVQEAGKFYNMAVSLAPVTRLVYSAGIFFEAQGDYKSAQAVYDRFEQDNPQSWLVFEANERMKKKVRPDLIISDYRNALSEGIYDVAGAFYAQGLYELSLYYNYIVLLLNEAHEPARYMIGNIYALQEDYDNALPCFLHLSADHFYYFKGMYKISEIYFAQGKHSDALRILQKLYEIYPAKVDTVISLGKLYVQMHQVDTALPYFNSAIEKTKGQEQGLVYFERAKIFEELNKWQEAQRDYETAIKLYPENPILLNHYGFTLLERKLNYTYARELLEKALELDPENPYIKDSLGWAYYSLGMYEIALNYMQEAVSQIPEDKDFNLHLGDIYWKLGREHEARIQWGRVLDRETETNQKMVLEEKLKTGLNDAE